MALTIPPDTRAVGTGDPPTDMNNVADMLGLLTQLLAQAGEVTTSSNPTAVTAVSALLATGVGPGLLPRPRLYNPAHLRRWRAAYALADRALVPVVVCGDSIVTGIGADNTLTTSGTAAAADGILGRLQGFFGSSTRTLSQNPGQGFMASFDPRVTAVGATQADFCVTALGQGFRLVAATQTLTFTVPAGVTTVKVVQGNASAAFNAGHSGIQDVTGSYNINGGGNIALSALTNTNLPLPSTAIAVTAGQTFQVVGPATAQTYISGFIFGNGVTTGVQVHRNCITGLVAGTLIAGQTSGVLQAPLYNGGAFVTAAIQANYAYASPPGVIIVQYGLNDQQFQNGGGTGSQNGVTLALYTTWIQQFCTQAVSDGWCVLLFGGPRGPVRVTGFPQVIDYCAALKGISNITDHVAYADIGELWGGYTFSQAAALQISGDEHPSKAGHGDIAAFLHEMLNGRGASGITELVTG